MVKLREEKVERIANYIADLKLDNGPQKGELLILGWGGTYGTIKAAVKELLHEGYKVAHAHLRHLKPFPKNLGEILHNYDKVLIPEINNGQLVKVIRDKYMIPAIAYNKIQGMPIMMGELVSKAKEILG